MYPVYTCAIHPTRHADVDAWTAERELLCREWIQRHPYRDGLVIVVAPRRYGPEAYTGPDRIALEEHEPSGMHAIDEVAWYLRGIIQGIETERRKRDAKPHTPESLAQCLARSALGPS